MAEHPWVLDHVGLLVIGPVAVATCPSSSHPTHILIGAALQLGGTHLIILSVGRWKSDIQWIFVPVPIMMTLRLPGRQGPWVTVQRFWRNNSVIFRLESSVARPTFLEVLGWANQEDCDDQKEGTRRKASHPGE